ncbi:hypothetical protein [Gluconobacter oxydans]|uniref:hypothetical protein n=1 Tax=Gluconobacter oxydans TaxID=442 RepID=UPI000780CBB8|nr:hypothetical protein [Gluconobacter oxydans]KXV65779.1 hypothetical protein AD950_03510 [Gluconobacter oxydans]
MTEYVALGAVALVVIALGLLVWFAYRAGKSNASVTTAQAGTASANVVTQKAEAMAQAETDKPATEDDVLARLKDGTA